MTIGRGGSTVYVTGLEATTGEQGYVTVAYSG